MLMSSENKVVSLRQRCRCPGAFYGPRDVRCGAAINPLLQVDFFPTSVFFQNVFVNFFEVV